MQRIMSGVTWEDQVSNETLQTRDQDQDEREMTLTVGKSKIT